MEAKEFIKENYTLINGGEDYKCEYSGKIAGAEDIAESYHKHKLELLGKEINETLLTILKVAANMLTKRQSEEIEEYNLPKSTGVIVKRKITSEAEKWNEINRLRSIELKVAYDKIRRAING